MALELIGRAVEVRGERGGVQTDVNLTTPRAPQQLADGENILAVAMASPHYPPSIVVLLATRAKLETISLHPSIVFMYKRNKTVMSSKTTITPKTFIPNQRTLLS